MRIFIFFGESEGRGRAISPSGPSPQALLLEEVRGSRRCGFVRGRGEGGVRVSVCLGGLG